MAEYIDREAFKKSVEERYCKPCKAEGKDHNGCWCRACWVDDMLDEVDCFQTADVAPVVHGRWVRDDDFFICAQCEAEMNKKNSLGVDNFKNYCPNCGAKMDGGDDDATNGNV